MKRISLLLCMLILLTTVGCSKEEEPNDTPVLVTKHSGTFISYEQGDSGTLVTIDEGGEYVSVVVDSAAINELLEYGYEVELIGSADVDGSNEVCTEINILKVPLNIELGHDGSVLMESESDTLYQALLAKVEYSYSKNTGGRLTVGGLSNSYYIDQDEKARYVNVVGKTAVNDQQVSWSSMEYIDKVTHERFYLYNYGDWTQSVTDDIGKITFAVPAYSIHETAFYRDGLNLVVEGSCDIVKDTYIEYTLEQVFGSLDYSAAEPTVTFIAKFVESTGVLFYAEYDIAFGAAIVDADSSITVEKLNIVLTGVDFNNEKSVTIPAYVRYVEPAVTAEPETPQSIMMCESVFGLSAEEVNTQWLVMILEDPYSVEEVLSVSDPDTIVQLALDMLTTYTLDQYVELSASSDLTFEQQYVVQHISYFLEEGVE